MNNSCNNLKLDKELICIVCPRGCQLKINDNLEVTGHGCGRGINYAKQEVTNPTRIITSTIKVINGLINRVPVITSKPVPKDKIFEVMDIINKAKVNAPVMVKDVIISNVLDLGIDIVSTREVLEK